MKTPTDKAVLAYMAGLIDGEGTICTSRRGNGHLTCRLQVVNCDRRMIDWIEDHFGQYIYTVRRADKRRRDEHRELHVFEAKAGTAEEILRAVLPYLVIKREQAQLFFEFRKTFTGSMNAGLPAHVIARRQELAGQISALNRRGP